MTICTVFRNLIPGILAAILLPMAMSVQAVVLDETCVVNVLNRTIQVGADGGWSMPNVPSNMGRVRARATCVQNGVTVSGQSDYFTIIRDAITKVGDIIFEDLEPIPNSLAFDPSGVGFLDTIDATLQLSVVATYADGSTRDVTAADSGVNYSVTNPAIATISGNGLVTAVASGNVLVMARKDGAIAVRRININVAGDSDGDGLPDDFELAAGLDPNDPVDAQEDQDKDGLSALDEFNLGTDINTADSDADGILDGEEVVAGDDGFITDPLNADSDGDLLSDGVEVQVGSSPIDGNDTNIAGALLSIEVSPSNPVLVFNTIFNEASIQLTVSGNILDGSQLDLTSTGTGTTYNSSDLTIASFGITDGQVFGGQSGIADITVSSNGFEAVSRLTLTTFTPVALSTVGIPGYANNIEIDGGYGYIAAGASGLQVVNVSVPESPQIVAGLDTPGTSIDIRIAGNLAYIADGASGLQIMDISDPLKPALVGSVDTPGIAQDLKVVGDFAYIADGDSGLQIVNISNPADPQLVGTLSGLGTARGVDIERDTAVVAAGSSLFSIDVTDRTQPATLGSVAIGAVKDVVMSGDYAYVAAFSTGYRVVDISDPANPSVTGGNSSFAPRDVELSSGLAFYAEQLFPNVIAYVNVNDPDNPVFQGTIDLSPLGDYAGTGIALDERYIYVTEESFVVSQDYKATGNTRLFIAQYRFLNDSGTTPPTVNITSPANGTEFIEGQTIDLAATATDDVFVAVVNFTVNGDIVFSDATAPYEYQFTADQGVGEYTIGALAVDLANNAGTASDVFVTVVPDTTPPVAGLTSPADGTEFIHGETVLIAADAQDDIGVTSVDFIVNGTSVFTDTVAPYEYELLADQNDGGYTIRAEAADQSGNVGVSSEISVTVIPDPLTTAIGRVTDKDGVPAEGATVTCRGVQTQSDVDGGFSVAGLPTLDPTISCSSEKEDLAGNILSGRSANVAIVRGGITDVGKVILSVGNILLLADIDTAGTLALVEALRNAGNTVVHRAPPEYTWDGTNPPLDEFNCVIHLNGYTFASPLPVASQSALVDFVNNGGGFIGSQWNGFARVINQQTAMNDLVLQLWNTPGDENVINRDRTYNVVPGQEGHPLLNNIPGSFTFRADGHSAAAQVQYNTDPSVVLMRVPSGGPAVLVREFGLGRVVNFSHAPNYLGQGLTLQNVNIQQLYINSADWACR